MAVNPFPRGSMEAAMWDYENAVNEFGDVEYDWLGDLNLSEMGYTPHLGETGLNSIEKDQQLSDMELRALMDLEEQSRDGLSARDKAELAKLESNVNRAHAGRVGAVRQNMADRGLAGSGMDYALRQQAAQDATEREALASLERAAMSQEGKRSAMSRMGAMAGDMNARRFDEAARKAEAQDAINRFNTGNQIDTARMNTNIRNQAAQYNHSGRQRTSDNNVGLQGQKMNARTSLAELQYNAAVDAANRAEERKRLARERRAKRMGAITGAIGAAGGGYFGGPAGATAGYSAGSGLGQAFYAEGGKIPGEAEYPGDDYRNDTEVVNVSPGEIIIPRTKAQDPEEARRFVEEVNGDPGDEAEKAIEGLLAAVNYLNNRKK